MKGCKYIEPWHGRCEAPTIIPSEFCMQHIDIYCKNLNCTNQAIAGCPIAGSLVCGRPYCEKCGKCKCQDTIPY